MCKVVVIGGGWAGCAAAVSAVKAGARVDLIERTDMVLGLGNVGGIFRNNGRFTAMEENIAMGNSELFRLMDKLALHKNVDFPGNNHASFYNVIKMEPAVRNLLHGFGINIFFQERITVVEADKKKSKGEENRIVSVCSADGKKFEGDVFVDCTGTTGPMGNCMEFGNGCSACILRCPAFGPRVSISAKAGGRDFMHRREDGSYGAFSGSCKLEPDSLSDDIRKRLKKKGFAVIGLPAKFINREKLNMKVCRQYALDAFAENIVLIDTGYAKMMTPFFNLEALREIPGFENARYADPYAGGKGNSVRYLAMTERDNTMKVNGVENLFCGGEKAGPYIGHTEAVSTGALAGLNAARMASGRILLEIPENCAVGALIAYRGEKLITFAGAEFFDYMKRSGLYLTDCKRIKDKGLPLYYLES